MRAEQAGEKQKDTWHRFIMQCDNCGDLITAIRVEIHHKVFCCAHCAEQASEIRWREDGFR